MNEILTISMTIMLVIFSMNLFLMVGFDLVGVNTTQLKINNMPEGLDFNHWEEVNTNKNDLAIIEDSNSTGHTLTQSTNAGQSIPSISDLIKYGLWIGTLVKNMVFYYITAMELIGVPQPIIFIVSTILTVIQALGLIGLLGYVKEVLRL